MGASPGLSRQILLFAGAGLVGFIVEAIVITALVVGWDVDIYLSRLMSFTLAVLTTWRLNRAFAFSGMASADRTREYGRYFLVQSLGALLNLGVFATLVTLFQGLRDWPILPLAAGAIIALVFNFLVSRAYVFIGRGEAGASQ